MIGSGSDDTTLTSPIVKSTVIMKINCINEFRTTEVIIERGSCTRASFTSSEMWSTPSKPNDMISFGLHVQQPFLCEYKLTSEGVCHRKQANAPGHSWICPSANIVGQSVEYV
jgi:hypothetical protein